MKLQNKTRCPDNLLLPIVEHARQAIGADFAVSVKITQSHSERITGLATRPLGVKVSLPKYRHDALACAYKMYRVTTTKGLQR